MHLVHVLLSLLLFVVKRRYQLYFVNLGLQLPGTMYNAMDSKEVASCRQCNTVQRRNRNASETLENPFSSFFFFFLLTNVEGKSGKNCDDKSTWRIVALWFSLVEKWPRSLNPAIGKKGYVTLIYIYILSKLTGPLVSLWNRHIILPLFVVAWIWNEITSDSLFFISFFLSFTETVLIQCNNQWSIFIFQCLFICDIFRFLLQFYEEGGNSYL